MKRSGFEPVELHLKVVWKPFMLINVKHRKAKWFECAGVKLMRYIDADGQTCSIDIESHQIKKDSIALLLSAVLIKNLFYKHREVILSLDAFSWRVHLE